MEKKVDIFLIFVLNVLHVQKAISQHLATAYHELEKLRHSENGFVALNEIYSQAVAEYYEGIANDNKCWVASGNEAPFYFAQAATAFARSQAHALQVYNALVPPAIKPTDLGLKAISPTDHGLKHRGHRQFCAFPLFLLGREGKV